MPATTANRQAQGMIAETEADSLGFMAGGPAKNDQKSLLGSEELKTDVVRDLRFTQHHQSCDRAGHATPCQAQEYVSSDRSCTLHFAKIHSCVIDAMSPLTSVVFLATRYDQRP
jgi:hypothetical protein